MPNASAAVIDLPAAVERAKPNRKTDIVFEAIFPPLNFERQLAAIYLKVVAEWVRQINQRILPSYAGELKALRDSLVRDAKDDLLREIDQAGADVFRLILQLTPAMADWTVRVEKWHRQRFSAVSKHATNIDLTTLIGPEGAQTTLAGALAENVDLITNVSNQIKARVAQEIFRGYQGRVPVREVAKKINAATKLGRDRSLRIASDQLTKLSAELDRERQEELGIRKFKWRHSGKVHFRPAHKARDGKVYSWEKNSLGGDLPGVAINCGCKAQAVIELE